MLAWPRIDVTVDAVVFGKDEQDVCVLLIQRKKDPFKGAWAIPGGFVDDGETLEEAVRRELKEETSLDITDLKQLHAFSDPDRDPRKRVISVAFYTIQDKNTLSPVAADDAANAEWFPIHDLPKLAFDHNKILSKAIDRLF